MAPLLKTLALPLRLALRSQRIAYVLSRRGMLGSLAAFGIEFGKRGIKVATQTARVPVPLDTVFGRNLAATAADLGPTFIKLGQMLATRPDIVGDTIADELQVLFDRVPSVSYRQIRRILTHEWGKRRFKEAIKSIEKKPLASASLSQTHQAELSDGTPVIVKIQKEGVADTVRLDILWLQGFVRALHILYPRWAILPVFEDFKAATLRELDYREEAKNIERFQKNYRSIFTDSGVLFPKHYPHLLTERVIVLEPIRGAKFSMLKKGSRTAKKAAAKSLIAVLEQIFDHGFFHADPHGGNLFFLEDTGRVGFIDLGLVGNLDPADKKKFLEVVFAILKRDRSKLAEALYRLGTPSSKTDYAKFEGEIQALLDDLKATGVKKARFDKLINQVLGIARKNSLHIPNRYILMIRSCLIIEGLAKGLDPSLSVLDLALPVVTKSLIKAYNPLNWWKK
jgi:ubiquinone biosynthesis protein